MAWLKVARDEGLVFKPWRGLERGRPFATHPLTMTSAPLCPCPGCSRHVKTSESACPFCKRELAGAFQSAPSSLAPAARLSRAALFALGAGGVVVACGSGTANPQPLYGGVAIDCDADPTNCGLPGNASDAGPDVTNSAYASTCPESTLPSCPLAGDASSCAAGCGLDSVPDGVACSGLSQCSMLVQPTPGCARTDGYVCSCVGGRWSCDDCWLGTALCEAGGAPEAAASDAAVADASTKDTDAGATTDAAPEACVMVCASYGLGPSCFCE